MKKIIVYVFIFLFSEFIFAQSIIYKVAENTILADKLIIFEEIPLGEQGQKIAKDEIVEYKINDDYTLFTDGISTIYVTAKNGMAGYIPIDSLRSLDYIPLTEQNGSFIREEWIPVYTYTILKSSSKNILLKYEPYWITEWRGDGENWEDSVYPTSLIIRSNYIEIQYYDDCIRDYLILDTNKNDNYCKITVLSKKQYTKINSKNNPLKEISGNNKYIFYFITDGDYLNMYIGKISDQPFLSFASTNDFNKVKQKIRAIAKNEKITLNDITWPRHADGTCDYDGSTKFVGTKEVLLAPSPSAISLSGTTKRVTTNLRLRSTQDKSSTVITTMQKGTSVKIIKTGSQDTIDGITSNWVQVEVQAGAKDRDGKIIKTGTTGWCFGGYLE